MRVSKTTMSSMQILALIVVLLFSIIHAFIIPIPIHPRTTIGGLFILSGGLFIVLYAKSWRQFLFDQKQRKLSDIIIAAYLLVNLVSLLVSNVIYDTVNIRLLLAAVSIYFAVQKMKPSIDRKMLIIHVVGIFTVFLASLSIFHLLLPDVFNYISVSYFGSRNNDGSLNYGILHDYIRGRLFPWGAIILTYPIFYASSIVLLKTKKRFSFLYFIVGLIILGIAMVSSNFRWTAICFMIGSVIFFRFETIKRFLSIRIILMGCIAVVLSIALGLGIGKLYLGYNLLDRILLQNPDRDVSETLGRIDLFNQAIDLSFVSPMTGIGIGNYVYNVEPYYYLRYFTMYDQVERITAPSASHNEFLTILSESGIFGLILFILFIYLTIKKTIMLLFRRHFVSDVDRVFLVSILVSYITFILYSLFENVSYHNYIILFAFSGIVFSWFPPRNITLQQ